MDLCHDFHAILNRRIQLGASRTDLVDGELLHAITLELTAKKDTLHTLDEAFLRKAFAARQHQVKVGHGKISWEVDVGKKILQELRFDSLQFRRGDVAVVVLVGSEHPLRALLDVLHLLDPTSHVLVMLKVHRCLRCALADNPDHQIQNAEGRDEREKNEKHAGNWCLLERGPHDIRPLVQESHVKQRKHSCRDIYEVIEVPINAARPRRSRVAECNHAKYRTSVDHHEQQNSNPDHRFEGTSETFGQYDELTPGPEYPEEASRPHQPNHT
mmetsp:Transcript_107664/g.303271  ORF Transcript_107664/g.303271 Transcript_107664/m.303271 type:complete len:271 (+) Transcript_107664:747-1559(+)